MHCSRLGYLACGTRALPIRATGVSIAGKAQTQPGTRRRWRRWDLGPLRFDLVPESTILGRTRRTKVKASDVSPGGLVSRPHMSVWISGTKWRSSIVLPCIFGSIGHPDRSCLWAIWQDVVEVGVRSGRERLADYSSHSSARWGREVLRCSHRDKSRLRKGRSFAPLTPTSPAKRTRKKKIYVENVTFCEMVLHFQDGKTCVSKACQEISVTAKGLLHQRMLYNASTEIQYVPHQPDL